MKTLLLSLSFLSCSAFGALLPSDRTIDWSQAGVPGGVPSYDVWTNMAGLDASGATDCSAAIQAALDSCPPFKAVKLPAGTFKLTNMVTLTHTNVLRGAGTNSTTLLIAGVYAGSWAGVRIGSSQGGDTTWDVVPATATKGATSIYCSSVAGLAASNVVCIEQKNDNSFVFNFSDEGGSLGQDWYYGTNYNLAQMVEVRSVSGTNITFWPPLNWNYTNSSLLPKVHRKSNGAYVWGCGLEDLTVGQTGANGEKNIDFFFAKYSWVSRVMSTNCYKYHVQLQAALGCEVRDSMFVGAQGSTSGGSYGLSLALGSTACKIENNAINNTITGVILAEMAQGNVIGYNYVHRTQYTPTNFFQTAFSAHDAHPLMNLFEGNVGGAFISDNVHGSSSHTTFFRNRLVGAQTQGAGTTNWTTQQNRALQWDNHNWYGIGVGNVIGNTNVSYLAFTNGPNSLPASVSVLEAFGYSSASPYSYTDTNAFATAILLGNYLIGTGSDGVPARESLGSTNLDSSLYLSAKPSWFGTVQFPPIGPDVVGYTNAIPAQMRFHGQDYEQCLLVLTEPVARGYLGTMFDDWIYQIRREGEWATVHVIECPRFTGGFSSNSWATLNYMSNAVRRLNPSAIQIVGRLPGLRTGGFAPDGHNVRCSWDYSWLGCTNLTFTDTTSWGMAGTTVMESNTAGDGSPDELVGTFSVPVAVIDFSGMATNSGGGTFSSGYLAGQGTCRAIDESYALRSYFTNDLAYRRQVWTNALTGLVYSSIGIASQVSSSNSFLSWTSTGNQTNFGGSNSKMIYEQLTLSEFSPNYVNGAGSWARAFWSVGSKSYNWEQYEGTGSESGVKFPLRRLANGYSVNPVSLVYSWMKHNVSPPRWFVGSSDVTVADAIRTSAAAQSGTISFDISNVFGDLTLKVPRYTEQPPGRATVATLNVAH